MKRLKKIFIRFILTIVLIVGLLYAFGYGYILKASSIIYANGHVTGFIDDYRFFPTRIVEKGTTQEWVLHQDYNKIAATDRLLEEHKKMKTVAFLIIKNDSLWHESYYEGYHKDSLSNSFSMAKSITEALLGKAVKEGYINMDDRVKKYFPDIQGNFADEVTVADLASMSSGSDWNEDYYNPFRITTEAYFSNDLNKLMLDDVRYDDKPGERFHYLSGDTQMMGMIVAKATGMTLSEFMSESFWKPMGMRQDALWTLDQEDGVEKSFCCVNSNARDFAKFGKLYTHLGNWEGNQILDTAYVKKSMTPRKNMAKHYGYSWWLSDYKGKEIAYMRGVLGQYVIIIPEDNIVIVRLGKKRRFIPNGTAHADDFYTYVDEAYEMLGE